MFFPPSYPSIHPPIHPTICSSHPLILLVDCYCTQTNDNATVRLDLRRKSRHCVGGRERDSAPVSTDGCFGSPHWGLTTLSGVGQAFVNVFASREGRSRWWLQQKQRHGWTSEEGKGTAGLEDMGGEIEIKRNI